MAAGPAIEIRRMLKFSRILLLLLFSSTALAQSTLPADMEAALNKAELPISTLSVYVAPAGGGQPALELESGRAMSPASTMKLLTSLVALEELGPAFRWKTQILGDATISKDVLRGNLYLRGGGDPNLSWEKLGMMLRTLRQQGLRKISGDLVLDRHYFQPQRPDLIGAPFDEHPDAYYNVIPDALLIHSNLTAIGLEANADKLTAHLLTPLADVRLHNRLRLNDLPCSEWESGWLSPTIASKRDLLEITLNGSFPRRCQASTHLNLLDRNQYIARMLRALWQEMGGSWQGQVRDGSVPDTAILLAERLSDTLADTLRIVNKQSDNGMARLLYLTLGAEAAERNGGDTLPAAEARVRGWLARHAIADDGLVLENGSGLSRLERLSAHQLAALLQAAALSNWSPEFTSSLPIAALDGTMRKRLHGSPAEQRARIKTGTLNGSTAIAGYVKDSHEQQWIVVGIVNHPEARKARAALDALICWVAEGRP
ncbi:MAG: D-alanyl-D-alanine carboxypeptidase/D-alanyl-D-alanine-endopeptidase [Burkholderiales bacterium]|nr:D-alanyl-D-alanine carboxypeptidase/D-alanyl-D-alanine-endopeptidase [Burkholderiales bacterium]